jgi:hypothetical protein
MRWLSRNLCCEFQLAVVDVHWARPNMYIVVSNPLTMFRVDLSRVETMSAGHVCCRSRWTSMIRVQWCYVTMAVSTRSLAAISILMRAVRDIHR